MSNRGMEGTPQLLIIIEMEKAVDYVESFSLLLVRRGISLFGTSVSLARHIPKRILRLQIEENGVTSSFVTFARLIYKG